MSNYKHVCFFLILPQIIFGMMNPITINQEVFFSCEDNLKIINIDKGWAIEKSVCSLLKKSPLNQNIVYLVCPWDILHVYFITHQRTKKVEAIFDALEKIPSQSCDFTVCFQYGVIRHIIPILKRIGIKTIFTPGAKIQEPQVEGINIVPMPYKTIIDPQVYQQKDILYSFVGCVSSHPIRKKIMLIDHPKDCFMLSTPKLSVGPSAKEMYTSILARSRYSLCPRGWQPNSYRFYESLGSGAIPVLISDEAWLPSLPVGMSWDDCIIRVAEKDIDKIPSIIDSIKIDDEERMREYGLKVYELFSGDNLVRVIREYYEAIER